MYFGAKRIKRRRLQSLPCPIKAQMPNRRHNVFSSLRSSPINFPTRTKFNLADRGKPFRRSSRKVYDDRGLIRQLPNRCLDCAKSLFCCEPFGCRMPVCLKLLHVVQAPESCRNLAFACPRNASKKWHVLNKDKYEEHRSLNHPAANTETLFVHHRQREICDVRRTHHTSTPCRKLEEI